MAWLRARTHQAILSAPVQEVISGRTSPAPGWKLTGGHPPLSWAPLGSRETVQSFYVAKRGPRSGIGLPCVVEESKLRVTTNGTACPPPPPPPLLPELEQGEGGQREGGRADLLLLMVAVLNRPPSWAWPGLSSPLILVGDTRRDLWRPLCPSSSPQLKASGEHFRMRMLWPIFPPPTPPPLQPLGIQ